jgi:DNA-binding NarL/FixJ family response regulator
MATRVLICDDHPVFRQGLSAALSAEDDFVTVGQAGSIAELRNALARVETDLVLLDIDLPDGTGLDVVAEIAGRSPVVILSAHDSPAFVRRALQDGAIGFIRKDAEPVDLLRLLRRAADGRTAMTGELATRVAASLRPDRPGRPVEAAVASLTPRQREVVALIAEGRSNREIAEALYLSEGTVKNYVTRILDAVGVTDRTKLAVLVVRQSMAR